MVDIQRSVFFFVQSLGRKNPCSDFQHILYSFREVSLICQNSTSRYEEVTTSNILFEIRTSGENEDDGRSMRWKGMAYLWRDEREDEAVDHTSKIDIGIIMRLEAPRGQCLIVRHWEAGSVSAVTHSATR